MDSTVAGSMNGRSQSNTNLLVKDHYSQEQTKIINDTLTLIFERL